VPTELIVERVDFNPGDQLSTYCGLISQFDKNVRGPGVPIPAQPDELEFLDPPHDDDGAAGGGGPNYDPICIPMIGAQADFLDATKAENNYRFRAPAAMGGGDRARPASGPRMANGTLHANFNMIGNDPPTNEVFANREAGAAAISDKALISYIDPDTVDGTCLRFVNNMKDAPPGTRNCGGQRLHRPAPAGSRNKPCPWRRHTCRTRRCAWCCGCTWRARWWFSGPAPGARR